MAKLPRRPTKRRTTTTKKAGLAQIETKIAAALKRGDFYQVSQMVRMVAERCVDRTGDPRTGGHARAVPLICSQHPPRTPPPAAPIRP